VNQPPAASTHPAAAPIAITLIFIFMIPSSESMGA
jgi:hypothetical protein